MTSLAKTLSSFARFQICRTLWQYQAPLRLRPISDMASLHVRSVELALSALMKIKLVQMTKPNKVKHYQLNKAHPCFNYLCEQLELYHEQELRSRSSKFSEQAAATLRFADSAHQLFKRVRKPKA